MDKSTLFDVKVRLLSQCPLLTIPRPHPATFCEANHVQDKIVLVTGGAKGIGRMISEGFIENGATVYISSRDAKACEQACKELNALGKGKADYIQADFYKEEDVKKVAEELQKREGSTWNT
jgi:NAD(P)-dependent dehydrogenase (short-subunit alcohol dehydrogenase family)